jgi:hypothetical protein
MLGLIYFLISFFSLAGDADTGSTGIFLTIDCRKDIPRKHEMLSTKTVCLTQNPIIQPKDFAAIGTVREAGANMYFDLSFTAKGHQTLVKLTANLPDSQLALVVNDEVFFVFKASELKVAPTFRFQTTVKYRNQVESVHRQLTEIMESASSDL